MIFPPAGSRTVLPATTLRVSLWPARPWATISPVGSVSHGSAIRESSPTLAAQLPWASFIQDVIS